MTKYSVKSEMVERFLRDTLIVVVLYKTELYNSITYQSLEKSLQKSQLRQKADLLVYDNSPVGNDLIWESKEEKHFNISYIHDPSNPGVSKAYNKAADLANAKKKTLLLVLDQDTNLPNDVLFRYAHDVKSFPNFPLYAPQIYSEGLLYSPCRYIFQKGSNLLGIEAGVHLTKNRSVINSGLLVDLAAFHQVSGYDEEVQLYFSDHVFFDRIKRHFPKFVIVNCQLEHELSSVDYRDLPTALTRFAYYCRGARQASRNNVLLYANHGIMVGLRSLVMSYRCRSLDFVNVFIRNFVGKYKNS